ncbi:beta-N-acetylhexosaminidase [Parapedobacter lycopersici]|uniref:beta-N-acetylhexosaminidase n=1 Tax=Parapedobacter lycopersici TaxID=1864939 RepID=UPI00214D78C5|nr:family 20 glycosylhydrolase [Parapedobacter lycopersici]
MKKIYSFLLAMWCLVTYALAQETTPVPAIIPAPDVLQVGDGNFTLSAATRIAYDSDADREIAVFFQAYVREALQLDLPVQPNATGASVIHFASKKAGDITNPEGYELVVSPGGIALHGKGAGLFYAMQTLIQLLPSDAEAGLMVPAVTIRDAPRYAYRGLHLDVGRHMFPISFIKKYIDFIAAYKLNTFHWHLTDDQGWRIEIKKYPKLAEVAAFRDQTLIGRNRRPGMYDGARYGGFYTQEEAREVVAYAAARYVTVIPEIELPGHAQAALTAYPHLGCGENPGPYHVAQHWGVFEEVFCAGKEETFTFLEDVLDEVIAIFPSAYIHIGGDECPKDRWETCPYCQKRIKDEGLADEHELQSYVIHRIEKYVNSKGRRIIGWDEILEGGLAPDATVMSWRGEAGGIDAAKLGHDVIMTANSYGLYFDHKQGPDVNREPLNIGGLSTLQKVYSADPTPQALSAAEKKHIIGVQANVWTEYIETPNKVEFTIFPRLFALSEIAWTDPAKKNWQDFSTLRVPAHLARLDRTETVYRVPEVLGLQDTVIYASEHTFNQLRSSVAGGKIYYTIDNFDPSDTDLEYREAVKVVVPPGEERVFKATVIAPSGRRSNYVRAVIVNSKRPDMAMN